MKKHQIHQILNIYDSSNQNAKIIVQNTLIILNIFMNLIILQAKSAPFLKCDPHLVIKSPHKGKKYSIEILDLD